MRKINNETIMTSKAEVIEKAQEKTKEEKGKYIVCEVKSIDSNRANIVSLNVDMDDFELRRFTITTKQVAGGYYLCKINAYKVDKKDNIFLIVEPVVLLDGFDYFSCAWDYLLQSGLFWSEYKVYRHFRQKMNKAAVNEKYGSAGTDNELYERVMQDMGNGNLTPLELELILKSPTPAKKAAIDACEVFYKYPQQMQLKWPNLYARLSSDESLFEGDNLEAMFLKWSETYSEIFPDNTAETYADIAEAVIVYYKEKKQRDKEERKAARKSAKVS